MLVTALPTAMKIEATHLFLPRAPHTLIPLGIPSPLLHNPLNSDTYQDNPLSHRPRKRFGQHFLHDPRVIHDIVSAISPEPGDALVEIGPGRGAITMPLLERTGRMDVVELDRDLVPALQARCANLGRLEVHQADALRFDFGALLPGPGRLRVVGNLPYNISTPLLFHLAGFAGLIRDMHFLLQREVVERITAEPGGKTWGRLSVMLRYRFRARRLFQIGPGAFRPPPKVESAFLRLEPHEAPPVAVEDESRFARLVNQAFSQRRKTIRNSLGGLLDGAGIMAVGIDPGLRPEVLDLQAFADLANASLHRDTEVIPGRS